MILVSPVGHPPSGVKPSTAHGGTDPNDALAQIAQADASVWRYVYRWA